MKLYRALPPAYGSYYEKQADVPKGLKFETVEFPFAASPKADFVDWLNERPGYAIAISLEEMEATEALFDLPPVVGIPQPLPTQPDAAHAARSIAFEDAFAGFPLALKLHYAGLALEDAREKIK